MRVYLVRHGKASKDPVFNEDDRPLTKRGREDVLRIADQMAEAGIEIGQIRHSGLLRAKQTAESMGKLLKPLDGIIEVKGLLWDDPVDQLPRELALESKPVMLVGHNPFMERLAAALLTGNPNTTPLTFATSGTACFESIEQVWTLRWMLIPEIMANSDDE